MTPDADPHINPAMAFRHLLLMLSGVGAFGVVVYFLLPSKPTGERILNWKAVDQDYVYTQFASGKTTKTFRD